MGTTPTGLSYKVWKTKISEVFNDIAKDIVELPQFLPEVQKAFYDKFIESIPAQDPKEISATGRFTGISIECKLYDPDPYLAYSYRTCALVMYGIAGVPQALLASDGSSYSNSPVFVSRVSSFVPQKDPAQKYLEGTDLRSHTLSFEVLAQECQRAEAYTIHTKRDLDSFADLFFKKQINLWQIPNSEYWVDNAASNSTRDMLVSILGKCSVLAGVATKKVKLLEVMKSCSDMVSNTNVAVKHFDLMKESMALSFSKSGKVCILSSCLGSLDHYTRCLLTPDGPLLLNDKNGHKKRIALLTHHESWLNTDSVHKFLRASGIPAKPGQDTYSPRIRAEICRAQLGQAYNSRE